MDQCRVVLLAFWRYCSSSCRGIFPSWARRIPVRAQRYLIAFTRDTKSPAPLSVCFPYLFLAAILYLFLFPRLPVALKLPVAVYAILLTSMAGQAMGRYLVVRSRVAKLAANGALLFMLSEVFLAIDRFRVCHIRSRFLGATIFA